MQQEHYTTLTITAIGDEVNDVKLFYFDDPAGGKIIYKAGQYLTFVLTEDGKEIRRSYSIASSPVLDEPLYIGVKRIDNGIFSRKLTDRTTAGDQLIVSGVGGNFVLPDDIAAYQQLFFFAAGSGIVPIYSLLKTALFLYPQIAVVLVYSNHSVGSTLFYSSLLDLEQQYGARLRIEFLFSTTQHLLKAHLHADLIHQILHSYSRSSFDKSLYYTCGPESYMRLCTFTLRALQVPAENIKKEIYDTTKPVHRLQPPDKMPHEVVILKGNREYKLRVQYPDTILQAAKKEQIPLPYSCEVGRCGNCIATCTRGKVWMSYNEVLSESETGKGMLLTCTAYPVEGDVTIRL